MEFLIKPVHEASYVSQPFLARRYVSQPFLTRRQEVQICQSIFSDKKNSLVARKFQEYISLNQARYVVQLQKNENKNVSKKTDLFLIRHQPRPLPNDDKNSEDDEDVPFKENENEDGRKNNHFVLYSASTKTSAE